MKRDRQIVPALMFHSVGLENHPWAWTHISEPLETFEAKIAFLAKKGFKGVFWGELYDHMAGRKPLADNSIFLTFDDGYLDNWVYVFPVLKKYGMKGTIFVSTDFVDPSTELRPNLDDVASGTCRADELVVPGFLNWAEMRKMERSGLVDVQSHAKTHTWYFSGPRILGLHRPHHVTPIPWLFWNARPDRKPYYLNENQQEFVPWGYPILEHQKSLTVRRFFPSASSVDEITDFTASNGGREFFEREGWQAAIRTKIANAFPHGQLDGRYESDDERRTRIAEELARSKSLIEENLDKRVCFICWPGGGNDKSVQKLAKEVGYKSWTLSSGVCAGKRNRPGEDPGSIKRIGTSNEINVRGRKCGIGGSLYQYLRVVENQDSAACSLALKLYKLGSLLRTVGGSS